MKYENLKTAKENGFRVPDFIVVRFEELRGITELQQVLSQTDFTDIASAGERLREAVKKYIHFEGEISLIGDLFAVRSSCNSEDGGSVSFAGQFETFLDVKREDIPNRIIDCVSSLYVENALRCALKNNINVKTLEMNVIVQQMVHPELSGVLFTANPQGLLNESVITVGRGRGDGVVSDRAETTSYYYSQTDKIYYFDGRESLLDPEHVHELIGISENLMRLFGERLLDIEFAIENGSVYILQIRKITTLSEDCPTVLDNSNIVESYPGISLPLTDSFVKLVYSGVFRGLAARVLKNDKIIEKYSDSFRNMVGSANGRMYYKISNWYTVIKFLPLSKKIIPVWQEMLGVKTKSYDGTKVDIPFHVRVFTYFNSVYELVRVPKNMLRLEAEFRKINDDFYEKAEGELTGTELVELFNEIRRKLLAVWDVTLLNDMYSFIFTGLIKSRLKKTNPDDYESVCADFISGISNIESMKPVKALAELAKISLTDPGSEKYRQKYDQYISVYGDRYLEELKLESMTFRTDRTLLDRKISEYAKDQTRLARLLEEDKTENTTHHGHGIFFDFCVKRAVLGIKNREISRLNRSRIFGMVRGIFLRLAENFVRNGLIETVRDIFFLTVDETFDLVKKPADMRAVVNERKREYEMYAELPAYSRLIFSGSEFNKSHVTINSVPQHTSADTLRGTPCSVGKADGEALVVTDVSQIGDVTGKILVTRMTDPGWVFLLSGAAGIIAQKGSLLSHTAIVSREIGIPSVVGVENVTEIIRNGDHVIMEGGSGIIKIVR